MKSILVASALLVAIPACMDVEDEPRVGEGQAELRGGSVVPTGALEAVVNVQGCSGTLISDDTVLTAAHCVCGGPDSDCFPCRDRRTVTFTDVRRVGSTARENVSIGADVQVHPDFCFDATWLTQDFALLKLDQPASEVVQVSPMHVEPNQVDERDWVTFVGYGMTNDSTGTTNCNMSGGGLKRQGTTQIDEYRTYDHASKGATLVSNDTSMGACRGDSGGPALSASSRVVGVASVADLATNSAYDSTFDVWDWLSDNACPPFDPTDPDAGFCANPLCPCTSAVGDCDRDSDCAGDGACVNNVGVSSGLPAYYDVCWDSDYLVTLYDGSNYSGASQSFPFGNWGAASMNEVGNDRTSSIEVAAGYSARLCSENNNWGNCQDFAGKRSLAGNSLNNNASNVYVRPGVTVYDYYNFAGTSQTFTVGSYGAAELTIIGNDDVSSLIAAPGINVRLCSENGAWGTCQEYGGRVGNVGANLNQRTSHIQVRTGVSVYRGVDYTGVQQSFAAGTYGAAALTTIGNDKIRSLVVAPGMKAKVCSENGGWGDCEEYTGWVPYVGATLDRRISYIHVSPLTITIPPIGVGWAVR